MNLSSVFVAVIQRDWAMMKRYIINTVSTLVSIYLKMCIRDREMGHAF